MSFASFCMDTVGACGNKVKYQTIAQATKDDVQLVLVDPRTGLPCDLTEYGIDVASSSSSSSSPSTTTGKTGVWITVKKMWTDVCAYIEVKAQVRTHDDAENGIVYIPLSEQNTRKPGLFLAMAVVIQDNVQKKTFPFYLEITPNLSIYNHTGPIAIYEVRLAVRDVCPEANFLIDTVDFKDEEIAWAIRRPLDYWNEIPPPLQIYGPDTFPYRYHWMEGAIGELLRLVAVWMRRNDLDYSAGGVTVDDTKKWPDYLKMGQDRTAAYQNFVKNKKIELNLAAGYESMGGYRWAPYR